MWRGKKSASDAETGKINKILPTQRNELDGKEKSIRKKKKT